MWTTNKSIYVFLRKIECVNLQSFLSCFFSDPIKAAELAFERAAEAAARAAEQGEIEEEEDTGPKPILPYSSFFILSSTNP